MTLSIYLTEYEGNLFSGWLDMDGINQEASLDRYYAELERRLEAEWPRAEIRIERQARTEGPTREPVITGENLSLADRDAIAEQISRIGEELYEDADAWLVTTGVEAQ